MARTPSMMVELGTRAPDFALDDVLSGDTVRRSDFEGKPLLVTFLSNHCPFVKHVESELGELTRAYLDRGVAVVGIMSNDVESYPDDGPESLREQAKRAGFRFPYLLDETQEVAKAYRAACTPDFFLYDRDHRLAYRGQMDDSRPSNGVPVTGRDLKAALDAVLGGKPAPEDQKPSLGCNVKWKPGNEPEYYG